MPDSHKELEERVEVLEQTIRETLLHLRESNNTTHMYMRYNKILQLLDKAYEDD